MGMFQTTVRVANKADLDRAFEERFWVDTGALYTFVPEDRLEAIGVRPEGRREFAMAPPSRTSASTPTPRTAR
jgi:predicted aspartyl protease